MKKTFIVLLSFICLSFTTKVYAQEVFYTNENGVSFTENEYEFIRKMFWEGAENLFTQNDYIRFKESNIINGEFDVNYYYPITPYSKTIYASNTTYSNDIKNFNNGFGVTVKLPTGSESITINQFFKVKKGGHIYGSINMQL